MFGRSPPACSSLFLAVALALSLPGGYHYLPNTCLLENFDLPSLCSLVMHFFFLWIFAENFRPRLWLPFGSWWSKLSLLIKLSGICHIRLCTNLILSLLPTCSNILLSLLLHQHSRDSPLHCSRELIQPESNLKKKCWALWTFFLGDQISKC